MYNILAGHHYQTDVHIVPCNLYHLPHTMCHMPYIGRLPLPDTLLSKFGGKTRWNIRKSTRDSRTQGCVSSLIWNIDQINNSANIRVSKSKTRWSIWTQPRQSELCASWSGLNFQSVAPICFILSPCLRDVGWTGRRMSSVTCPVTITRDTLPPCKLNKPPCNQCN